MSGEFVDCTTQAVLYKATDIEFASGHGADYTPGTKTACDDFDPEPTCGGGLHFSPRTMLAERYCHTDEVRFVACRVRVKDLVLIGDVGVPDKCKVPSCECLFEVDVHGDPIETVVAA